MEEPDLWYYNKTAMKQNNTVDYSTPIQLKLPVDLERIIKINDAVYSFSEGILFWKAISLSWLLCASLENRRSSMTALSFAVTALWPSYQNPTHWQVFLPSRYPF